MEKKMKVDLFAEAKQKLKSRMAAASEVAETAHRMSNEAADEFIEEFRKLIVSCNANEFEVLLCSAELSDADRQFAFEERMKYLLEPTAGDEPTEAGNAENESEGDTGRATFDPMDHPLLRFLHDLSEAIG